MPFWEQAISMLRDAMFGYAQLTQGSLGTGILVVTFVARALLLPLAVKLGVAAARHQAAMSRLKPELDALREQHQNNPQALHAAMQGLFAREGVSMFPLSTLVGSLAQLPLLIALFSAVQQVAARGGAFLWIRDLARPDVGVAVCRDWPDDRRRSPCAPIARRSAVGHGSDTSTGDGHHAHANGVRCRVVLGRVQCSGHRSGVLVARRRA